MAEYLIQDSTLTDIADAIREKTNISENIATTSMAQAIRSISTSVNPTLIASNGYYTSSDPIVINLPNHNDNSVYLLTIEEAYEGSYANLEIGTIINNSYSTICHFNKSNPTTTTAGVTRYLSISISDSQLTITVQRYEDYAYSLIQIC